MRFRCIPIPAAFALALSTAAISGGWAAGEELGLLPPVTGTSEMQAHDMLSGLALSGYDPVAYLTDGAARPGLAQHEAIWAGFAWRFASQANRAAFLHDPAAFVPRIGGYDTAAAASGRLASADPAIFSVRGGRVYLFRTAEGRRRFEADIVTDGAAAEAGWARIKAWLAGHEPPPRPAW